MFQCKVTQAQNPYWFTLWLWSSLYRLVRLQDLDFDRKQLKVVQGKGKKDRYVPLSIHLSEHYKIHQS
jgi:integrase